MFSNFSTIIESFDCDNQVNIGPRWEDWITRLQEYFDAADIDEDKRMLASLFFFGGTKLRKIHSTLPEAIPEEEIEINTKYAQAVYRLNSFFNPKKNTIIEIYKFREARQDSKESIEQFVTRLRLLAQYCEFADTDNEIVTQVIQSCLSTQFRRKLLRTTKLNLHTLLELGRINDTVESQAQIVEGTTSNLESADTVNYIKTHNRRKFNKQSSERSDDAKCWKCGRKYPHKGECPAKGQQCRSCKGWNHFEVACLKSQNKEGRNHNKKHYTKPLTSCYKNSDKINIVDEKEDKDCIFTCEDSNVPSIYLTVNRVNVKFITDTGASVNVLDYNIYERLIPRPKLIKHDKPVYAFNSSVPLTVEGKFNGTIQYKDEKIETEMIVIKARGRSLINYQSGSKLKIVEMVNAVEYPKPMNDLETWKSEFPTVFSGKIGKLKNFQLELHIDEKVIPIQAANRNHPFHLRQAIEKQIKNMLEQDIIEEVTGEPTAWLSETVNVRKKGTDDIRICVDMKAANQAIGRFIICFMNF